MQPRGGPGGRSHVWLTPTIECTVPQPGPSAEHGRRAASATPETPQRWLERYGCSLRECAGMSLEGLSAFAEVSTQPASATDLWKTASTLLPSGSTTNAAK